MELSGEPVGYTYPDGSYHDMRCRLMFAGFQLGEASAPELAGLSHEIFRQREENVRLVGVIARKNAELAEAKGRREVLEYIWESIEKAACALEDDACSTPYPDLADELIKHVRTIRRFVESASVAQEAKNEKA
jgi:hypothetical protein